jgi:alpha-D-ribose 1-methylphosphonate 5-triphosphate synthase subunit PhnL
MSQPPVLSVRNLSKTITLHILDGTTVEPFRRVSFDVGAGEFVVIVGPSGSGKSSIVKTVHRTYLPTGGEAWFRREDGALVDLVSAPDRTVVQLRRQEIGFVSQFLKVEPRVPALDVVAGPLIRRGVDEEEARRRAAELLQALDVPLRLWGSYPTLFSGGEQQRINIARALIGGPRLLLADEPTSALDAANTGRVVELLLQARQRGVTILGVFHDIDLIERLADRVIVMRDGRVAAEGRIGEVEIPRFETTQEFAPRV